MEKILPLVALVSSVACGDTNEYYLNGGSGENGSYICEDIVDYLDSCNALPKKQRKDA